MNKQELIDTVDRVRKALQAHYLDKTEAEADPVTTTIPAKDIATLLASFDAMQQDMGSLVSAYVGLMQTVGPLEFWAKNLVATTRTASKGRAFVSKQAATKLAEAVEKYEQQDKANQKAERQETVDVVATPVAEPISQPKP